MASVPRPSIRATVPAPSRAAENAQGIAKRLTFEEYKKRKQGISIDNEDSNNNKSGESKETGAKEAVYIRPAKADTQPDPKRQSIINAINDRIKTEISQPVVSSHLPQIGHVNEPEEPICFYESWKLPCSSFSGK